MAGGGCVYITDLSMLHSLTISEQLIRMTKGGFKLPYVRRFNLRAPTEKISTHESEKVACTMQGGFILVITKNPTSPSLNLSERKLK